jgi:hypothetical protein
MSWCKSVEFVLAVNYVVYMCSDQLGALYSHPGLHLTSGEVPATNSPNLVIKASKICDSDLSHLIIE